MSTDIQKYHDEVTRELANKETLGILLQTTFKGLEEQNVKQAIVEGMIRGFTFKDFLEKNIYAIPFTENKGKPNEKQGYSLITSIDYARKIGMRSGIVGSSEPAYEMNGVKVVACSVTVKRKTAGMVGDFTAKVYFEEYTTGRNLWTSKPRTMIAKVAEMHALRKACPEEMSQVYVEEEMEQKTEGKVADKLAPIDLMPLENKLKACKSYEELGQVFSALPYEAKLKLVTLKDELKAAFLKAKEQKA